MVTHWAVPARPLMGFWLGECILGFVMVVFPGAGFPPPVPAAPVGFPVRFETSRPSKPAGQKAGPQSQSPAKKSANQAKPPSHLGDTATPKHIPLDSLDDPLDGTDWEMTVGFARCPS